MHNWLSLVSRYRTHLMGLSILWIMLFHSHVSIPDILMPLDFLKTIGYAGVEIFFLLSGFGLAFSYHKDPNPKGFYIKRLARILPTFWICISLMQIFPLLNGNFVPGNYILALTGLDFLVCGTLTTWFIPAIFCCYLLFPTYWLASTKYNPLKTLMVCTIAIYLLTISFRGTPLEHLLIFLIRLPVFLLGVYLGQISLGYSNGVWIKKPVPISIVGGVSLGLLIYLTYNIHQSTLEATGLRWYPTVALTLAATILFCKLLQLTELFLPKLLKLFYVFGIYSLELYLLHLITFELPQLIELKNFPWNLLRIPEYACYVLLALVLAIAVNKLLKPLSNMNWNKNRGAGT